MGAAPPLHGFYNVVSDAALYVERLENSVEEMRKFMPVFGERWRLSGQTVKITRGGLGDFTWKYIQVRALSLFHRVPRNYR